MKFDFEDEEVIGLYVNLLKTISLKLNENTVQFFFSDNKSKELEFPLYTEAIKFATSNDGMVRAAVKNLTLNAFTIPLASLRTFFAGEATRNLFVALGETFLKRCEEFDAEILDLPVMSSTKIDCYLSDLDDELTYFNDIWSTNIPVLRAMFMTYVWMKVVPALLKALLGSQEDSVLSATSALYILDIFFNSIHQNILVSLLASLLFGGDSRSIADELLISLHTRSLGGSSLPGAQAELSMKSLVMETIFNDEKILRSRILEYLSCNNPVIVCGAVRLISSIVANPNISDEVLYAIGLLPRRKQLQKDLIAMLTKDNSVKDGIMDTGSTVANGTGQDVPSYPMRHADIYESTSSPTSIGRFEEFMLSLSRATLCPHSSPIMLMQLCWIMDKLSDSSASQRREVLKTSTDIEAVTKSVYLSMDKLQEYVLGSTWSDCIPFVMQFYWNKQRALSAGHGMQSCRASISSLEHISVLKKSDEELKSCRIHMKNDAKQILLQTMSLVACLQILQLVKNGTVDADYKFVSPKLKSWTQFEKFETHVGHKLFSENVYPCTVAFSESEEQDVLLTIDCSYTAHEGTYDGPKSKERWFDPPFPTTVLLEDTSLRPARPQEIISVAPIGGTSPQIDLIYPRWLHVHIRPQLSVMLKSISITPFGIDLAGLDKAIDQGIWVLSFQSQQEAGQAYNLLQSELTELRQKSSDYIAQAVKHLS